MEIHKSAVADDQSLTFSRGPLEQVACAVHPASRREYALLWLTLAVTSLPWLWLGLQQPGWFGLTISAVLTLKIMSAFVSSAKTGVSHHVRFLLAGSNPFGMAAASSLLFGGVDAIIDWREDAATRHGRPLHYWGTVALKFLVTPMGCLFIAAEFFWDLVLLRRSRSIAKYKWHELFALARFHDLISPEKSNDLFYADLAFAKHGQNPTLYQWNRLRSLVFEIEQSYQEYAQQEGFADGNLFHAGPVAAYQILKRLEVERIEDALERAFDDDPTVLPLPPRLPGAWSKTLDH